MSASELCVIGWRVSTCQLQSFTCKWPARMCLSIIFFIAGVTSQSLWFKDTQCRFPQPILPFEGDCDSHFTCSSSHRKSWKWSCSAVRGYISKQQNEWGILDFDFLTTISARIFFPSDFTKPNYNHLHFNTTFPCVYTVCLHLVWMPGDKWNDPVKINAFGFQILHF